MAVTTLSEFQTALRTTGRYETADDHRAPKRAKAGAWTTLRFSFASFHVFPMCAIAENLRFLSTEKWAEYCFSTVTVPESLGMKLTVEGFENRLNVKGPVLYLCNHMSTTETILLPPILLAFGPFSFVAKASLAHLPFLERAAEHMKMIGIGRQSPREDFMKIMTEGTARIKGGDSFLIFPQGTRERVFSHRKYSSIGAKLAERAACPVMPIVVDTRSQLRRDSGALRKVFRDFGPVDTSKDIRVCCGPAIPCGKAREMHEAAFDWMAGKLEEWGLPTER